MPPVGYPAASPSALSDALLRHAEYYAREYLDYPLTADGRTWLRSEVSTAVGRMVAEGRVDENSYTQARSAVERWLMRADPENLREARHEGPTEIREADLVVSLRGLCPGLGPIC